MMTDEQEADTYVLLQDRPARNGWLLHNKDTSCPVGDVDSLQEIRKDASVRFAKVQGHWMQG